MLRAGEREKLRFEIREPCGKSDTVTVLRCALGRMSAVYKFAETVEVRLCASGAYALLIELEEP